MEGLKRREVAPEKDPSSRRFVSVLNKEPSFWALCESMEKEQIGALFPLDDPRRSLKDVVEQYREEEAPPSLQLSLVQQQNHHQKLCSILVCPYCSRFCKCRLTFQSCFAFIHLFSRFVPQSVFPASKRNTTEEKKYLI